MVSGGGECGVGIKQLSNLRCTSCWQLFEGASLVAASARYCKQTLRTSTGVGTATQTIRLSMAAMSLFPCPCNNSRGCADHHTRHGRALLLVRATAFTSVVQADQADTHDNTHCRYLNTHLLSAEPAVHLPMLKVAQPLSWRQRWQQQRQHCQERSATSATARKGKYGRRRQHVLL